jgi:hypothetical protein
MPLRPSGDQSTVRSPTEESENGIINFWSELAIFRLKIGSFDMVEGKRLQVNSSATRDRRELAHLLSIL